ncbi:hypothetical protein [Catenulispora subtropica]|uniref:Uncharacterized protein n=1 Tax=Catenulispora subtropica TaxID=450798 RepID=A0ABN2R222_9ACTN
MTIGADDTTTPLSVPAAAERVLDLTQAARPEDLPVILGALTATELAAGVARMGRRLPEPVVDHVIEHGPPGARRALAWQLRLPLRHAGVLGYDTARRKLLRLADPEVDRALFGRLDQVGVAWVRAAILRDRTGPDGEAIIPPDLRAKLVAFLDTAVLPRSPADLADTDTGDPDFELLRVLAGARDQALALPAARILGLAEPIPSRRPGWRDQTWVQGWDRPGVGSRSWALDWDEILDLAAGHRDVAGDRGRFLGHVKGLDEAAAREDIPEDVRQSLLARYPQAAWHAGAPDVRTLRRIPAALKALEPVWGEVVEEPEFRLAIRLLIIRGLSLGTLTAAEVLEHAVPASAVLDLAWRAGDGVVAASRGRSDLARELRRRLRERIGRDDMLWYTLLVRSFMWSGTVAELIDSVADLGPDNAMPPEESAVDGDSANVLMVFAPRTVAEEFLGDDDDVLTPEQVFLLHHRPLAPGLIDRALDPGAGPDALGALLRNPATPASALRRLLHNPVDPVATRLSLLCLCLDPDIRYAALELLEKQGVAWAQITHFVKNLGEANVYRLVAAAPTAERLHFLLRKFGRYLGPDTTALLFGRLAAEAGPEPVWDVATFLDGAVDAVDPMVRASMVQADAEPLLRAAEIAAARDLPGVTIPDPRTDPVPHPDDPSRWPLEDAVRRRLDGRPERWQAVVRRLMSVGPLDYPGLAALVEMTVAEMPDASDGVDDADDGEYTGDGDGEYTDYGDGDGDSDSDSDSDDYDDYAGAAESAGEDR